MEELIKYIEKLKIAIFLYNKHAKETQTLEWMETKLCWPDLALTPYLLEADQIAEKLTIPDGYKAINFLNAETGKEEIYLTPDKESEKDLAIVDWQNTCIALQKQNARLSAELLGVEKQLQEKHDKEIENVKKI